MFELKRIFAEKQTENGDIAFSTTGNKMTDILFMSQYYRTHIEEMPTINDLERAKIFAMFIRDPRHGLGERDIGRALLKQVNATPEEVVYCGRYDDLMEMGEEHLEYIWREACLGNKLAKKWLPRLQSGQPAKEKALMLCKVFSLSKKEYRKMIKVETTEYQLSNVGYDSIKYEHVPSLGMLKYFRAFKRNDEIRFEEYLESVKRGTSKMNISITTPYDIFRKFVTVNGNIPVVDENADMMFKQLGKVSLGSILPIIDNSGSMYNLFDAQGKAKAIGHYVAKNSTYLPNHIISFSKNPKLIELGNTYEEDVKALYSYSDISNTNFGEVMRILSKLKKNFPDWLLVLSDMEFDKGSHQTKEECMKLFKRKRAKTRIIWWNLNERATTTPELDSYGNIFISGYSPQLLAMLEVGFNQEKFLNRLLDEYETIKNKT